VDGDWPRVCGDAVVAITRLSEFNFFNLQATLRPTIEFSRATGLADCYTASNILREDCDELGAPIRFVHGLLLGIPKGSMHSWTEVYDGSRWIPVDPLLLKLLSGQFNLRHELSTLDFRCHFFYGSTRRKCIWRLSMVNRYPFLLELNCWTRELWSSCSQRIETDAENPVMLVVGNNQCARCQADNVSYGA